MKIDNTGIELIKGFEGVRLEAYKAVPTEKYYTIGYGHYGSDVTNGKVISRMEAEALLKADLQKFENYVNQYVTVPVTQNMFDSLVSFCYNVGAGNFKSSTLLKKLNACDYVGASKEFSKWNKSGGKVLNGLVKRRKAESDLFMKDFGVLQFSKSKHGNLYLSANFKVKEFACKDGSDEILIDVPFVVDKLQNIRKHFSVPVTINSAYRTDAYNKKVGGASRSYHMSGMAFDIVVKGYSPATVSEYCKNIGINGIIQYNTFTHVDNRTKKYWAVN